MEAVAASVLYLTLLSSISPLASAISPSVTESFVTAPASVVYVATYSMSSIARPFTPSFTVYALAKERVALVLHPIRAVRVVPASFHKALVLTTANSSNEGNVIV